MAYAAYKEPPGSSLRKQAVNEVIDVTVASVNAYRVRRALASCEGVGVLRCEPLLHPGAAYSNAAVRVRLTVGLPPQRYADLVHAITTCVEDGEIGPLMSWHSHLQRCGMNHGD